MDGRRERSHSRVGLEGLDDQRGESAGGGKSGRGSAGADAVVGHHREEEVLHDEVGAEFAGFLCAPDEFEQGPHGAIAVGAERAGLRGEFGGEGGGEAAVEACISSIFSTTRRKPCQASALANPSCTTAVQAVICSANAAVTRASFVGKRRYRVAAPTRARRAISRIGTSKPSVANTFRATARMRSRLSRASERSMWGTCSSTPLTSVIRARCSVTVRSYESCSVSLVRTAQRTAGL